MQKNHTGKILAIGIIVLFIGVGIYPAFAVDTKQSMVNKASEEDCGCNEVSDAELVKVKQLINRVESYSKILLVLSRNNLELKELSEELSNMIIQIGEMDYPLFLCVFLFWAYRAVYGVALALVAIIYKIGELAGNFFYFIWRILERLEERAHEIATFANSILDYYDDLGCPW